MNLKKLIMISALPLAAIAGSATAQDLSPLETRMVDDFHILDEQCRGGIYVEASTQKACGARDYVRHLLSVSDLCFERRGDFASDGTPFRCDADSVRYDEMPDFQ